MFTVEEINEDLITKAQDPEMIIQKLREEGAKR